MQIYAYGTLLIDTHSKVYIVTTHFNQLHEHMYKSYNKKIHHSFQIYFFNSINVYYFLLKFTLN